MTIKGIVATETTSRSTRYSVAIELRIRPFVASPTYAGSLATTRIGKYVRGSAAADRTIEYSVTLMGSIVVSASATENRIDAITTTWNRAASRGFTNVPHCHPKNWLTV